MAGWRPEVAETHVSILVMLDDRAHKLKKPVRTAFLDLSTREAREVMCHREVELNRLLAPDVYLGVADVTDTDGRPCDHLVVMRRMPPGSSLSDRISEGGDISACIDAVTDRIAAFHREAPRSDVIDRQGTVSALRERWRANLEETGNYVGRFLAPERYERVERSAESYLAGRGPLFEARIAAGRIRDCHGDMLADDVYCLDDGPRILDRLEFDDALRYVDVLDDVACLAMDLERAGGESAAQRLTSRYLEATGDDAPSTLLHHFIAYRAFMRAKIACLRAEDGEEAAPARAARLLEMSESHLKQGRVRILMIGGLPGTGKTTCARRIEGMGEWELLRSDVIRKGLLGVGATTHLPGAYLSGPYDPATTDDTYRTLLARAEEALGMGRSLVLDATWSREHHREMARDVARRTRSELFEIRCVLDARDARTRLLRRAREGTDASDADADIAERMAGDFDAWPQALELDTSGSVEELGRSLAEIGGRQ